MFDGFVRPCKCSNLSTPVRPLHGHVSFIPAVSSLANVFHSTCYSQKVVHLTTAAPAPPRCPSQGRAGRRVLREPYNLSNPAHRPLNAVHSRSPPVFELRAPATRFTGHLFARSNCGIRAARTGRRSGVPPGSPAEAPDIAVRTVMQKSLRR